MSYQYKKHLQSSKPQNETSVDRVGETAVEYKTQPIPSTTIAQIDTEALGINNKKSTKGDFSIEQELSQLQQEYQQAKLQLLERHKSQQQSHHVGSLLEMLGDFDDEPAITRLELIRRYSVLRKQVREKIEFVGAKELAKLLDENKTNWTRDLANLHKKNKLLAVRRLGSTNWEYPLNQIDPIQGAVYPALESLIGQFKAQGLSDWDVLIWLNLPTSIEQDANPVLVSENDDLDTLLDDFNSRQMPDSLPQVLPIELLQQGQFELFNHQANGFLNPEFGG